VSCAARLLDYEILLLSQEALRPVLERHKAAGHEPQQAERGWLVNDPAQIGVRLRVGGRGA
jgi:hypothetical protein